MGRSPIEQIFALVVERSFCKMLWCKVGIGFWLITWSNNSQAGDSSKFGDRGGNR
jgi:hypothetical protein